jgi:DNA-binding transcriptional LysR family regulator
MELRHLRYFVAVAEELHFGRAAARLHISQPPLSLQIRDLEQELSVRLLARNRRRVELTAGGAAFLEEAREILRRAERAGERARRASRGEVGELGIGFVTSATNEAFAAILREHRRSHPCVELRLYDQTPDQQLQGLRAGHIDVGFLRPPIDDPSLAAERVWREPLLVALPVDHPLASQPQVRWKDLIDEPFVTLSSQQAPGFRRVFYEAARMQGFVPQVKQYANDLQTVIWLVAVGMGVAIVSAGLSSLARRSVVYRPLRPRGPMVEMAVAWRRDATSPALEGFLEVTRHVVRLEEQKGRGRAPEWLSTGAARRRKA